MSEGKHINSLAGEIFAKDGLNWIFSGGKIWKAAGISAIVVFLLLMAIVFLEHKTITKFAVIKLFHTSLIIFMVVTFSSLLCAVGMYPFLKPNQRHVAWTFSDKGCLLKDKAGNQIITPWTQVKSVKFHTKGICIYCKPFGSRWVPNRLLTDEAKQQLRELAKAVGVLG